MCVRWDSRLGAGKATHVSFSFLVVKKKGTTGLKLSNLMNLGRKKSSSLDSPERSLETSSECSMSPSAGICLRAG